MPISSLAPPETVWEEMDIEQHARSVVDLVGHGLLAEADLHIAAHAEMARGGEGLDRHGDALAWSVMRALLSGRERAARAGLDALLARGGGSDGPGSADGYWLQRLWVVFTWGDEHERYALVDHCRERAWCHEDIAWRGRLTLLLAHLGRTDEAVRELDATTAALASAPPTVSRLDLATDLVEAAALLGDGRGREGLCQVMASAGTSTVVAGRAWVCKGSVSRYQALAAATAGDHGEADRCFRAAVEAHRRMGADALLARTLDEWGRGLATQDPARSAHLLRESADLQHRLDMTPAGPGEIADLAS
ncbi:MAG: hypothetical protein ACR2HV_11280 [Acidimicrobiales bacterium]